MAPPSKTHQLLEITIISAQDLDLVSKSMRTYATAWMNPKRKLSSRVDEEGKNNPTWNEKFVFRVEEEFLRRDTSAVMIEIYASHWFRDVLIGTVRCLIGNLIPQVGRAHKGQSYVGMRFVALQVRRPSGRPQGILNIGVALLDSSMRSMPLYKQPAMSAIGYHDLMDDPPELPEYEGNGSTLCRSRSERSEAFNNFSPDSSMIIITGKVTAKESSILSITECMVPIESMKEVGKASSIISGAEFSGERRPRLKSKGKTSSVMSYPTTSKENSIFPNISPPPDLQNKVPNNPKSPINLAINVKTLAKFYEDYNEAVNEEDKLLIKRPLNIKTSEIASLQQEDHVIGAPATKKPDPVWSEFEVGPSTPEVAPVTAETPERRCPVEDNQSSLLEGWSMDESVEGFRSKLEKWQMELPALLDGSDDSTCSYTSSSSSEKRSRRTSKKEEERLFACFRNVFGVECQCVCGKSAGRKKRWSTTKRDRSSFAIVPYKGTMTV